MRATNFSLIALAAALASAQSIPSCATSCISQALPANCNLNPQCICSDASFISTISCCVSTACDASGQAAALQYAQSICAPVGVTNLPTAAVCSGGATSSTGAASATGSSAAASLSSASATLSSILSSASGASTAASGSASKSASGSASTTTGAASSGSGSASSSIAVQTGSGADKVGVYGKGLAGVALGALAFL